jgi:hypothetical protein
LKTDSVYLVIAAAIIVLLAAATLTSVFAFSKPLEAYGSELVATEGA